MVAKGAAVKLTTKIIAWLFLISGGFGIIAGLLNHQGMNANDIITFGAAYGLLSRKVWGWWVLTIEVGIGLAFLLLNVADIWPFDTLRFSGRLVTGPIATLISLLIAIIFGLALWVMLTDRPSRWKPLPVREPRPEKIEL